jgi:D-alanyl-D-alanine carboxypeptidase (penicillin-binding protein 5/6)
MGRVRQFVLLVELLLIAAGARHAQAVPLPSHPTVTAKAAILIDNQTGEVLWQRNPDLPLPPASTTKIVTAILALQSGRLDDSFRVTPEAAQAPPSKISLRPGWSMRLRDLVYAVLLNSANDASVVIAEGLAGSVPAFAERMNARARALGATHSHFVNPNGLPAADHYSTARDLATMFEYALEDPVFRSAINTKTTIVSPASGSSRRIVLRSHNRLLGNYHIHVVGKTGWTLAAKKCFVGAAQANGREIGVAVLGSRDLWGDLRRLIEYGFNGTNPPFPEAPAVEMVSVGGKASVEGDDQAEDATLVRTAQRYSIRIATFRQLNSAIRLKNSVRRNGYPARVEKIRAGRRPCYCVSVGAYPSRDQAQQVATTLKKTHRSVKTVVVTSS